MARRMESLDTLNSVESTLFEIAVFNLVMKVINDHTRPLAQTLFGKGLEPAILVIDGTYIYIQKSSQLCFQGRSFNLHKHRPLIKPMVIMFE
jgi:hypothetical protein